MGIPNFDEKRNREGWQAAILTICTRAGRRCPLFCNPRHAHASSSHRRETSTARHRGCHGSSIGARSYVFRAGCHSYANMISVFNFRFSPRASSRLLQLSSEGDLGFTPPGFTGIHSSSRQRIISRAARQVSRQGLIYREIRITVIYSRAPTLLQYGSPSTNT